MRKRLPLFVAIIPLVYPDTTGAKKIKAGIRAGIVVATTNLTVPINLFSN
jgi:hypothetical protein